MAYLTYSRQTDYPLCFLVPTIRREEIQKEYLDPFGIPCDDVLVVGLHYAQGKKKTPVAEMKDFITTELITTLEELHAKYLIVADAEYFKLLAKVSKVDVNLGYVLDCAFGPWKVVYVPNYRAVFYDPDRVRAKIAQGMGALIDHIQGTYREPGNDILKFAAYPKTPEEISQWLERLLEMDQDLAIDIEAFDLKHHKAGIGTISFAWSQHEGIAFPVDYREIPGAEEAPYGIQKKNPKVRQLLRGFFERYLRKSVYHNISYDVYVLVYQLYMTDLLDTRGLLRGMEILLPEGRWDDTKLITYLATNSCAGNKLSLKDQAQEFSGNYAQSEIHDITRIKLDTLLRYNLIDACSTWFVYTKHWDTLVTDQQEEVYQTLFKPATLDIIQMQLTGLPLNMARVKEVKAQLEADESKALTVIQSSPLVQRFVYRLDEKWVARRNQELKKKRVTLADAKEEFNPNSNPQLQDLLYTMLGLPVINLTDSKQPATDGDTLKALINHTQDPEVKAFLQAMLDYGAVNKILTSFIPAMEAAPQAKDGWHYLFGNFNLGGTLSGRLSSSNPNLQNLPANSKYAKLIKSCFEAPSGWLFCGLDFNALEARIDALTTKDPAKLAVYTDGYDSHSYNAYGYWPHKMLDIRTVTLEQNLRTFKVAQDGQTHYLIEGDLVELSDGTIKRIEELCPAHMKSLEPPTT